ncbi:hypothetical protein KKC83_04575 [Patescibacteria group bacterium]|nr:hypothetical protein [Candidatus Falkowbacteria bacterium]MBU3906032.1 hypothetical protein [Patescibacteria group bacterium]MCG2698333.1 hypothetical protein [Candidatus Parcubacteria bacterium]MBU4015105.1 hypothetical protein [Patescibacteria group bacterium]MBU4026791.1 hypothetical protein [Patescibacteria group bacterium]
MNSELKVLKKIWENKEESNIKLISSQTKFGIDYIRYICDCLFKKGWIKPIKGKRDWYKIAFKGIKELECRCLIKPKVFKKEKNIEKVIYYFPKKLKVKPLEDNFKYLAKKVSSKNPENKFEPEEKKLNLGQSIERAACFLNPVRNYFEKMRNK